MGRGKDKAKQESEDTILKTYRNSHGDLIYHNPNHDRCRGTGFLIENYVVMTDGGERWGSRSWDCSCRNPIGTRPNFDRDNPRLVGMTQDQLDAEHHRAKYDVEEQAKIEGQVSRILALPAEKRFGAVMEIVKPAPREIPEAKVVE